MSTEMSNEMSSEMSTGEADATNVNSDATPRLLMSTEMSAGEADASKPSHSAAGGKPVRATLSDAEAALRGASSPFA